MNGAKRSGENTALTVLAVIGQLASLFPFAAAFEATCVGDYTAWHFLVIYAVWAAFWAFGALAGKLAERIVMRVRFPKKLVPAMNFLSKLGFLIPSAGFVAAGIALGLPYAVYLYVLTAAVIAYFGGILSMGKPYSAIFSSGWFVLYIISGTLVAAAFGMSEKRELAERGSFMLCAVFAAVILLFAVIRNQSSIDKCTNQRDRGKAVLPHGLRGYNALLGGGVFAAALGLFVLAKPLARLISAFFGLLVRAFLSILSLLSSCAHMLDESAPPPINNIEHTERVPVEVSGGETGDIVTTIIVAMSVIAAVVFRKQILNALKGLFAPLFRTRDKTNDIPFADEITESAEKRKLTPRAQRRAERELMRRYVRESSPKRKYRLGYALYLMRLSRSEKPPERYDTTDEHRAKGESVFNEDLRAFSETYNRVRYAERTPTAEELAAELELLKRIR